MNREELIHKLAEHFQQIDVDGSLINFVDDEVDWTLIASIAFTVLIEESEDYHDDKTLEKVRKAIEGHGNGESERDCIINDILNAGILFRERK